MDTRTVSDLVASARSATCTKKPTQWRKEKEYLRKCHTGYERGAILDAINACDKCVKESAENNPFRRGKVFSVSCAIPPIRRGKRKLFVPGFGIVATKMVIPEEWNMR